MATRLYRATVEFAIYVVADDERSAIYLAEENIREETWNQSDMIRSAREVRSVADIDAEWADSRPYRDDGADDGLTCTQVMEGIVAARPVADAPGQGELFREDVR